MPATYSRLISACATNPAAPPGRVQMKTDFDHGLRCATPVATLYGPSGAEMSAPGPDCFCFATGKVG